VKQTDVYLNVYILIVSATMLLAEVGLKCIGEFDSMTDLVNESTKEVYHVPNFMICDPVFKKDFSASGNEKAKTLEVFDNDIN